VNPFLRFKSIWIITLLFAFLGSSFACGHKPAYLKEGKTAEISERWRVKKINPERLTADENSVLETFGTPDYIRFYRRRSLEREKVYAWIYLQPARLDDDLSSLNEQQKNTLFWGGITAGTVAALGLLYYYFIAKE